MWQVDDAYKETIDRVELKYNSTSPCSAERCCIQSISNKFRYPLRFKTGEGDQRAQISYFPCPYFSWASDINHTCTFCTALQYSKLHAKGECPLGISLFGKDWLIPSVHQSTVKKVNQWNSEVNQWNSKVKQWKQWNSEAGIGHSACRTWNLVCKPASMFALCANTYRFDSSKQPQRVIAGRVVSR